MMPNEDIKMCNCADCGRELVGESQNVLLALMPKKDREQYPPRVRGRINGRPYCLRCLNPATVRHIRDRRGKDVEEPNASSENAVKALEENR